MVLSIGQAEVYHSVNEMGEAIDDDADHLIKRTLIIGFSGLSLVLVIILFVSLFLTKPLRWMAMVADQIVANAGNKDLDQGLQLDEDKAFYACTPTTEVTYLVAESY